MYCPYCGREMALIDGVLTCAAGEMSLSPRLAAVLVERFPVRASQPPSAAVGRRTGVWYCPGCGAPLGAGLHCRSCGLSLRDVFHQLVELHPHRDEHGHW